MCLGCPIVPDMDFYRRLMARAYELCELEEMNFFDAIEQAHGELSA